MTSFVTWKRVLIWVSMAVASIFLLVVLFYFGLMLTGISLEWLSNTAQSARHSLVFMAIRYALYAVIWGCWKPMLRQYVSDITDELVLRTRKTLLVLIICYELMCWLRYFF